MYNICIEELRFEWNEEKNLINQEKQLRPRKPDMNEKGEKAYEN